MGYFHDQALTVPVSVTRFEVGKKYKHGYIGDSNLFTTYKVVNRTKCFIHLEPTSPNDPDPIKKVKVFNFQGIEHCRPDGYFSMCPILSAEKEVQ